MKQKVNKGIDNYHIIGKTFGHLTVKSMVPGTSKYLCECDCGNTIELYGVDLTIGHRVSCGKCKDPLIGKKIQNLTILEKTDKTRQREFLYKCLCDCGNITYMNSTQLKHRKTVSCGCLLKEKKWQKTEKEMVGKKFGKLTVIKRAEDKQTPCGQTLIRWECRCDCGNTVTVDGNNLKSSNTKSCGCLKNKRKNDHEKENT